MWVERVIARAFGPFRDAELDLGPGLTVVVGPNEAGKSTWHAALRLALTGIRRGKGGRTVETRTAEERHRPWDDADGAWEVGARLHLDDGRVIDISQDLAGRVDCRAVDVGLGRDVSTEIIFEGSPDASRWLGLDRHAFAATVSVDQAGILSVLEAADGLQDDLQRAAASAGRDATAAEAIARLAEFRKAAVGADTRVAVGPLRQARQSLAVAEEALGVARQRHDRYLHQSALAQSAASRVTTARAELSRAEALVTASADAALVARARRAAELAARHPKPPPALAEVTHDAAQVAAALEAWHSRPATAVLDGPDADVLEARLADLPALPQGDLAPHPSVLDAIRELDRAQGAAAELASGPARPDRTAERLVLGTALGSLLAGGVALVLQLPLVAALLVLVATGLGGWLIVQRRTAASGPGSWAARARQAEARVAAAEGVVRDALAFRGADSAGDVRGAVDAYTAACAARAAQASLAGQEAVLREQIAARLQLEGTAAEAAAAIARAESEIRAAARRVGRSANGEAPDHVAGDLEAWQRQQADAVRRGEQAVAEWQELTDLLDGRSLATLEGAAADATRRLAAADPERSVAYAVGPDATRAIAAAEAERDRCRQSVLAAEREAAALQGELRLLSEDLPSVAAAEEAASAAQGELDRVLALAAVIDETVELLKQAEEQVHRDVAPILADAVRSRLPAVSGGIYGDAAVDPRDLAVRVREAATGRWRDARLLSEGTREQVYLLLRVAMTEHLVTTGETAPLFCDEVTAQADDERRGSLLAMLHELSRQRQVVLFTHDRRIADWAAGRADADRDRIVLLEPIARS